MKLRPLQDRAEKEKMKKQLQQVGLCCLVLQLKNLNREKSLQSGWEEN